MTTKTAVVLVTDGTEEIEYATSYAVLVRAGFKVTSIGVSLEGRPHATLSRGLKVVPDLPQLVASIALPDVLMVPGGLAGSKTFCSNDATLGFIRHCRKEKKVLGFICAGSTVLAASITSPSEKTKITSHPLVKDDIIAQGWDYSEDRVMVDGNIITSRGPGTALLFALTVVEVVCGKEKRDEVAGPMIVADTL